MDGGQTKANVSGWSIDTLHAHMQSLLNERDRFWLKLLDEHDKRYTQRFNASERAVEKAEGNAEKWRDNANEWRAAMNDKDKKVLSEMMPRNEILSKFDSSNDKIAGVRNLCMSTVIICFSALTAILLIIRHV